MPDYGKLVRFLVEPFLEQQESLKVDCEVSSNKSRVWIRLAFESADKGRVFGRGGRNIQAIRTVLEAAAQAAGQTAHLDVYDSNPGNHREEAADSRVASSQSRRPSSPRPASKAKS